mmetsp:Transcript_19952/g.33385  ORF Transcript_19952/g.33385 Transcript_19952/m.33385 type:complete len:236 (+) Transcript_19952:459-1166(+)|eukprot:CAMPEP_0174957312 /NCGR_PEP_ID=MMETSP0004_2-20121128/2005_1 /TAXON_ID=420556 /ORGANISM="Ochromonas sp., Strain CCMP1393" /LENGTH=235 /DNA_ID=CAMNT_0016205413 /DNA_START=190 /DNA_END=897 /DNA_ORIENTATION=+
MEEPAEAKLSSSVLDSDDDSDGRGNETYLLAEEAKPPSSLIDDDEDDNSSGNETGEVHSSVELDENLTPIQKLQKQALELSGLSAKRAFAIDDGNLGEKFGEYVLSLLMESFCTKIYGDKEEWFRDMFYQPQQDMQQNLADYILQRIGGPAYYSDRKKFPSLAYRHNFMALTPRVAERWLEHLENALEELDDEGITSEDKEQLFDHLRYTAFYLVASRQQQIAAGEQGIHYLDNI